MHCNIEKVSVVKHVIRFLNYHRSMLLLTLTEQCLVMRYFAFLNVLYTSTNDSHVVMLTSVEQLTYFDNMSYARSSSFNFRCA